MDKAIINISLAFDDKYTKYAYVTLLSLFKSNADSEVHVYILQYDLSDASRKLILSLSEKYNNYIYFLYVDRARFNNKLPIIDKWPIEVYFRLLLTELLPADVDRIIYLDSDMIVNNSLKDMYETDMTGFDLAACYDLTLLGADLNVFLYYRSDKLASLFNDRKYINSGSLLMDMTKLRKSYPLDVYMDAAKELDYKIYAPDQDLLNYVHKDKIKLLDSRKYNYPAYIAHLEQVTDKSLVPIMHFTGPKPWQGGNHVLVTTEAFWWEYAFEAPFADEIMKEFIINTCKEPGIREEVEGTDKITMDLVEENAKLKSDLQSAMNSVQQVIAMFENR